MEIKERIWKKSRNTKMFLALLFAVILLASIVPIASADGWNYRRAINITNSGSVLTDYQVLVTLNTSNFDYSKANADGSDLRFTNYTNSAVYRYWIETWNTSGDSRIWVNVSSVPDGDSKMYMWYNNSAAGSESDGDATFNFFDDFEGTGDLNGQRGWQDCGNINAELQGDGTVKITSPSNYVKIVNSKDASSNNNIVIEYRGKFPTSPSGGHDDAGVCFKSDYLTSGSDDLAYYFRKVGNGNELLSHFNMPEDGGYEKHFDWYPPVSMDNEFHIYTMKWTSPHIIVYIDETQVHQMLFSAIPSGNKVGLFIHSAASTEFVFDWIFVRKYADHEPTTSVSATEEDVTGPVEPVPELPTIILFSIGLLVLAGYAGYRRKK